MAMTKEQGWERQLAGQDAFVLSGNNLPLSYGLVDPDQNPSLSMVHVYGWPASPDDVAKAGIRKVYFDSLRNRRETFASLVATRSIISMPEMEDILEVNGINGHFGLEQIPHNLAFSRLVAPDAARAVIERFAEEDRLPGGVLILR